MKNCGDVSEMNKKRKNCVQHDQAEDTNCGDDYMMNNCVKDDQTDNTNCGEDHHHGGKECRDNCEMSGCNCAKGNEDNSNCGDEGRDSCDVQDCGDENEQNHNVDNDYCAEDMNTK